MEMPGRRLQKKQPYFFAYPGRRGARRLIRWMRSDPGRYRCHQGGGEKNERKNRAAERKPGKGKWGARKNPKKPAQPKTATDRATKFQETKLKKEQPKNQPDARENRRCYCTAKCPPERKDK